jgi:hypothetical protein
MTYTNDSSPLATSGHAHEQSGARCHCAWSAVPPCDPCTMIVTACHHWPGSGNLGQSKAMAPSALTSDSPSRGRGRRPVGLARCVAGGAAGGGSLVATLSFLSSPSPPEAPTESTGAVDTGSSTSAAAAAAHKALFKEQPFATTSGAHHQAALNTPPGQVAEQSQGSGPPTLAVQVSGDACEGSQDCTHERQTKRPDIPSLNVPSQEALTWCAIKERAQCWSSIVQIDGMQPHCTCLLRPQQRQTLTQITRVRKQDGRRARLGLHTGADSHSPHGPLTCSGGSNKAGWPLPAAPQCGARQWGAVPPVPHCEATQLTWAVACSPHWRSHDLRLATDDPFPTPLLQPDTLEVAGASHRCSRPTTPATRISTRVALAPVPS